MADERDSGFIYARSYNTKQVRIWLKLRLASKMAPETQYGGKIMAGAPPFVHSWIRDWLGGSIVVVVVAMNTIGNNGLEITRPVRGTSVAKNSAQSHCKYLSIRRWKHNAVL